MVSLNPLRQWLLVKLAFIKMTLLELQPPTDPDDPVLDRVYSGYGTLLQMSPEKQDEYISRVVRLRNHVYSGEGGPVPGAGKKMKGPFFITQENLKNERDRIRSYNF